MNFDPQTLAEHTDLPVLNLGIWSYLTFDAFALLLHARREAGYPPKRVLLIVHPASLKRSSSDAAALALLHSQLCGAPRPRYGFAATAWRARDAVRDRILNRLIPRPLPASYAPRYGNTQRLADTVIRTSGFLPAPETRFAELAGRPDYSVNQNLAPALSACRKAAGGSDILIALSPTPRSLALSDTPERYEEIARTLASALYPARALSLPAVWDDAEFVDAIHFNAAGRAAWQRRVLESIQAE